MCVEGEAFADIGVDVCDADQHFNTAVGELFGDFDLIEIARSVVIDRRPEEAALIECTGSEGWAKRL